MNSSDTPFRFLYTIEYVKTDRFEKGETKRSMNDMTTVHSPLSDVRLLFYPTGHFIPNFIEMAIFAKLWRYRCPRPISREVPIKNNTKRLKQGKDNIYPWGMMQCHMWNSLSHLEKSIGVERASNERRYTCSHPEHVADPWVNHQINVSLGIRTTGGGGSKNTRTKINQGDFVRFFAFSAPIET